MVYYPAWKGCGIIGHGLLFCRMLMSIIKAEKRSSNLDLVTITKTKRNDMLMTLLQIKTKQMISYNYLDMEFYIKPDNLTEYDHLNNFSHSLAA